MIALLKRIKIKFIRNWTNFKAKIYLRNKGVNIGKILHCQGYRNISVGKKVSIDDGVRLDSYNDGHNSPQLIIGSNVMICFNCTFLYTTKLQIGDNCLIASNVFITTEDHGINPCISGGYLSQELVSKPVTICDGCWIGEKVIICKGVTIGKHSIIGAGSVVTRDIPEYSIAAGNPAKVIKRYDFQSNEWVRIQD